MKSTTQMTRRSFVQKAATITAIGFAAPHFATGAQGAAQPKPGPNSRIHLGLIGCGGMGSANLSACASQPDVVVTGACDVWESRRNAVVQQYKDTCKGYRDFRELLQQPDLDAVIIATPPHWHALIAIAACEAGKDIYLQKPMTLHLAESFAVRNAVRRHAPHQPGRHPDPRYGELPARRGVHPWRQPRPGRHGSHFQCDEPDARRRGPQRGHPAARGDSIGSFGAAPRRCGSSIRSSSTARTNHCSWMDYSGGWTPGMAPHIIDLPIWAFDLGFPLQTSSSGGRYFLKDDGDAYDNHEVLWQYPNFTLTWMSSLTNSYGFDLHGKPVPERRLGVYFHGANGTLYADYGHFKIVPEGNKMDGLEPPPKIIPPSPGHEREWLDCIKSRQQPSCSVFYHIRVDVPVVLSLLSLKLGRSIRFDPATEKITGDAKAAKLAVPKYRAPWKFPKQYLTA